MKKIIIIFVFIFTAMLTKTYGVTYALSNLNNIAKFTAANALTTTDSTNITTATMFGGLFALTNGAPPTDNPIANYQRSKWSFNITNFGNASADFVVIIAASNVRYGTTAANGWAHHFNNTNTLHPLGPLSGSSFSFVISNVLAASNNAYMSYLIKLSNRSADSNAHAYRGADTVTWYGGNLGILTNHNRTNGVTAGYKNNPIVYLQHAPGMGGVTNQAGFLTAIISGPVLRITKTIVSITNPSKLWVPNQYAVPGSYITYMIVASNIGGANATNTKIIDTFNTNALSYVSIVALTNFGLQVTNNGLGFVTFTNFTNRMRYQSPANRGVIIFKCKIK